jgi:hypothetical protein
MSIAGRGVDASVECEINMGFPLRHVRGRVNCEKILTGVTNGPAASAEELATASADREAPSVARRASSVVLPLYPSSSSSPAAALLYFCLF